MKTEPNDPASPLAKYTSPNDCHAGLTKREYFAIHSDVPWNAVLDTMKIKHPEKNGMFTVKEMADYRAEMKLCQADALIQVLNE